jgi:DNA-binding LacI/PurR family transcriptional regulator
MVPYHLTSSDLDQLIKRTGASVVLLGSHIDHPLIDCVFGNDGEATYDAMRWLIECKGHRRIGMIGVTRSFSAGERRGNAFLQAMNDGGLAVPPEYIRIGDWSFDSGKHAAIAMLQLPEPPSAIYALNDYMAIGVLTAAQEMGRCVPDDLAVIGFDNIPEASWIRPRLTTIAQYPTEMGQEMAKLVFERIEGSTSRPRRNVEVPCRFIEREST